jgi:hypothetical protein
MDFHEYVTGELIEAHLAERRARAAIERLLAAHRRPRPGVRSAIGHALIRLGSRLARVGAGRRLEERAGGV